MLRVISRLKIQVREGFVTPKASHEWPKNEGKGDQVGALELQLTTVVGIVFLKCLGQQQAGRE